MIFQSKNTKGKIGSKSRLKNVIDHSSKNKKFAERNISLIFFTYFAIFLIGIGLGYLLYNELNFNLFSKNIKVSKENKVKINNASDQIEVEKNDFESIENLIVKSIENLVNERINPMERNINEINSEIKYLRKSLEESNNLVDKDLISKFNKLKIQVENLENRNFYNQISDELNNLKLNLNNEIFNISILSELYNLKNSLESSDYLVIKKNFIKLKSLVIKNNNKILSELLSELEFILNNSLKSKLELKKMFFELYDEVSSKEKLIYKSPNSDKSRSYMSSLIVIKKVDTNVSEKRNNELNMVRFYMEKNNVASALEEAKKIKNNKLVIWKNEADKYIRFESVLYRMENLIIGLRKNN